MNEGVQLFVYTRAVRVHTYDVGSLRGLTRCAGRTPAGVQLDWLEHKRSISGVCGERKYMGMCHYNNVFR